MNPLPRSSSTTHNLTSPTHSNNAEPNNQSDHLHHVTPEGSPGPGVLQAPYERLNDLVEPNAPMVDPVNAHRLDDINSQSQSENLEDDELHMSSSDNDEILTDGDTSPHSDAHDNQYSNESPLAQGAQDNGRNIYFFNPLPVVNQPQPVINNMDHIDDEAPLSNIFETYETKEFMTLLKHNGQIPDSDHHYSDARKIMKGFFKKFNELINNCSKDGAFFVRMNDITQYACKHLDYLKSIIDIAHDGHANCNDRTLTSLLEMEKLKLNHCMNALLNEHIWTADIALNEVINLEKQLYNLHCYEKLAAEIGGSEAVEVLLFLLKNIKTSGSLPMGYTEFQYEEFAGKQNVNRQSNPHNYLELGSVQGQEQVALMLETATNQHDKFTQFFAGSDCYATFINQYLQTDKQQSQLKENLQELIASLSEVTENSNATDKIQGFYTKLEEILNIQYVNNLFEPEHFLSIRQQIQQASDTLKDAPSDQYITSDLYSARHNSFSLLEDKQQTQAEIAQIYQEVMTQLDLVSMQLQNNLMHIYNNTQYLCNFQNAVKHLEVYKVIGFQV